MDVLEDRVIRYLASIDHPVIENAVGVQLFGKQYRRDIAPRVAAERSRSSEGKVVSDGR